MLISPVVAHLRAYCPSFARRVAGGLDLDALLESTNLAMPAAYVVMESDQADGSKYENAVAQDVVDQFAVYVAMATTDEAGRAAADQAHGFRAELCRALVGWCPAAGYDPALYRGGELVAFNRARQVYRFEFAAGWQLGSAAVAAGMAPETWQEVELLGLPELTGLEVTLDAIDPADRNLSATGGPDGRPEAVFNLEVNNP